MSAERLERTPSQTVGPYLAIGLTWTDGPFVVPEGTPGAIWIRGRLLDGAGDPVSDGMIETWQADPAGRFAGDGPGTVEVPGFRGFGRARTDRDGGFAFLTVKPGQVDGPGGLQAPHLFLMIFARGLGKPTLTRLYFGDEDAANASDPVLRVLDEHDRATLMAVPTDAGYRFEIHLQGEHETVFFAI